MSTTNVRKAQSRSESSESRARAQQLKPVDDLVDYLKTYARERPEYCALACLAVGWVRRGLEDVTVVVRWAGAGVGYWKTGQPRTTFTLRATSGKLCLDTPTGGFRTLSTSWHTYCILSSGSDMRGLEDRVPLFDRC